MTARSVIANMANMARGRDEIVPIEKESADRRGVLKWMGDRRLKDVAPLLDCSVQFLSRWLRHEREIKATRAEHWSRVTGVSKSTLLNGLASRWAA